MLSLSPSHVRTAAQAAGDTQTLRVLAKASEPHDCPPGLPPLGGSRLLAFHAPRTPTGNDGTTPVTRGAGEWPSSERPGCVCWGVWGVCESRQAPPHATIGLVPVSFQNLGFHWLIRPRLRCRRRRSRRPRARCACAGRVSALWVAEVRRAPPRLYYGKLVRTGRHPRAPRALSEPTGSVRLSQHRLARSQQPQRKASLGRKGA